MILIVGLGNPGKQYENTYHNIGFMALDYYAKNRGISFTKTKHKALFTKEKIKGETVIFAKPQTFMNLSGTSVLEFIQKYKIQASKVLVIYDDVDLDPTKVRFRNSGSGGTHNGMRNIVKLCSNEVARVRVGIGKQLNKNQDLASYVLSKISKNLNYEETFEAVADLIDEFISKGGKLENKSVK